MVLMLEVLRYNSSELLLPFTEQFVVCTHGTRVGPFVVGYVWLTLIFLFAQMYSLLEICVDCRR